MLLKVIIFLVICYLVVKILTPSNKNTFKINKNKFKPPDKKKIKDAEFEEIE